MNTKNNSDNAALENTLNTLNEAFAQPGVTFALSTTLEKQLLVVEANYKNKNLAFTIADTVLTLGNKDDDIALKQHENIAERAESYELLNKQQSTSATAARLIEIGKNPALLENIMNVVESIVLRAAKAELMETRNVPTAEILGLIIESLENNQLEPKNTRY